MDLHWLPIEYRIEYKINLITYKCVNHLAPAYLEELLEQYTPNRSLRSSSHHLLQEKRARTTLGDRAFSIYAPILWNKLPETLKVLPTLNAFKAKLKTHLFKHAFNLEHIY